MILIGLKSCNNRIAIKNSTDPPKINKAIKVGYKKLNPFCCINMPYVMPKKINPTVGKDYSTTKLSEITKDGVTYVLVPAKNPSNATGQYVDGNVDVIYVYSKKEAPTPAPKTESKGNNVEQKQSSDLKASTLPRTGSVENNFLVISGFILSLLAGAASVILRKLKR